MQYTVFYDSHCPLCSREIELLRERCGDGRIVGAAIDEHLEELAHLGVSREAAMTYLYATDDAGRLFVGMDAVRLMYRESGWVVPAKILSLPLVRQLADWAYSVFARNRYRLPAWLLKRPQCENGSCTLPPSQR